MDPFAAIGLASNIISFIDYGIKVVSITHEIYTSSTGASSEVASAARTVGNMRDFFVKLQPPEESELSDEEKALVALAKECKSLSGQILGLIDKVKPKDKSIASSFRAGIKTKWYEGDRRKLEERLTWCRGQLGLRLTYLASNDNKRKLDKIIAMSKDDADKLEKIYKRTQNITTDVSIKSLSPEAQRQLTDLLGVSEYAANLIVQQRVLDAIAFEDMYGRYETVHNAHYETFKWIFNEDQDSGNEDVEGWRPRPKRSPALSESVRSRSTDAHPSAQYDSQQPTNEDVNSGSVEVMDADDIAGDKFRDDMSLSSDSSVLPEDTGLSLPVPVPQSRHTMCDSRGHSTGDSFKDSARSMLLEWIESGDGIFHISGKMGCGKSTLMKFLCEHARTRDLLGKWAARDGPRDLVLANFFFWKPGNVLQKSLAGLLRSLLHDVLQTCPGLIPEILPNFWHQVQNRPWQAMKGVHIAERDVRQAFLQIIGDTSLYRDHCFCFFIDGLDEYEGTYQDDSRTLVDMLRRWVTVAPGMLKLCVSSREYNVFMNAFDPGKRIRLHDLTREDMKKYVEDKLSHVGKEDDKEVLKKSIVDNAHGIFLWVVLVVKRVREQIEDGRDLEAMKREIDTLPKELEGLFVHILNSLSGEDLKRAYMTFAMVLELMNWESPQLSLLAYSFLDDFARDPTFAMRSNFSYAGLSNESLIHRSEAAIKQLNGCCRGLVEVSGSTRASTESSIRFTHRSVPEFLSAKPRKDLITSLLEGTHHIEILSQLALARARADLGAFEKDRDHGLLSLIVQLRIHAKLDIAPYAFLEALSLAVEQASEASKSRKQHQDLPANDEDEIGSENSDVRSADGRDSESHEVLIPILQALSDPVFFRIVAHVITTKDRYDALLLDTPQHPVYASALVGNFSYVRWKVLNNPNAASRLCMAAILWCIICSSAQHTSLQDALETVELLVTKGGLGAEELTDVSYIEAYRVKKDSPNQRLPLNMPVWAHVLVTTYEYSTLARRLELPRAGYVIEKYLEHGADPYFAFMVTQNKKDEWKLRVELGKEKQVWDMKYIRCMGSPCEFRADSLEDFVGKFEKFENVDKLRQLINRNKRRLEGLPEIQVEKPESKVDLAEIGWQEDSPPTYQENPTIGETERKDTMRVYLGEKATNAGHFTISTTQASIAALLLGILLALMAERFYKANLD